MKVICIATPKQIRYMCASGFIKQFGIYEAEYVPSTEYRIKLDHVHLGYTITLSKKLFMPYNEWLAKERERQIKELFD
jgi:hypothetical protein